MEKPPRRGLQPSRAVQQPPLTSPRPPMTSSRPLMSSFRPPRPSGGPASGSRTLPSSPAVFASHSPVPQVRSSFCQPSRKQQVLQLELKDLLIEHLCQLFCSDVAYGENCYKHSPTLEQSFQRTLNYMHSQFFSRFEITPAHPALYQSRPRVVRGRPQSRQSAKPFLQSSELGLPYPLNRRQVCSPLLWFRTGGGGYTRLRERGWGSPNSDKGTYSVVYSMKMYFVGET